MLAVAAKRAEGHDNVELREADATSLPVPDADFDRALAVQVLEYVRGRAGRAGGVASSAAPGRPRGGVGRRLGHPVLARDRRGADATGARRVGQAPDASVAAAELAPELRDAGFEDVRMDAHPFATTELIPDAYGGSLVPLLEQYVAEQGGMRHEEAKAWADEQRELGERGEFFFTVTQFCFAATRSG